MGITLTEAAADRVSTFLANRGKGIGVRLGVKTTGCSGMAYVIEFVDETNEDDETNCSKAGGYCFWLVCRRRLCSFGLVGLEYDKGNAAN